MGVEFNWQIESEDDWKAPSPLPEQQKPLPWPLLISSLLLLVIGGGIAAGLIWQRSREGEARLKYELRTVANLEAQALRSGDRQTFLSLQDEDDAVWYLDQKERHLPEPGQQASLAVLKAGLISESRAWAKVAWGREEDVYQRVQFYRQAEGQWQRTGVQPEYFGAERNTKTAHFFLKYTTRDEPTVNWMIEQLETWYDAACADLGCDDTRRINILLAPNEGKGNAFRLPDGFIVNSPQLRGVREDGAPLPEEREEIARILLYTLISQQAGDLKSWRQPYLLPQFVNWELKRLGLMEKEGVPTPLLDAVMASRGLEGVQKLLSLMGETESESEALNLALGMTVEDLDVTVSQYLSAILFLERQMLEWKEADWATPSSIDLAKNIFGFLLSPEANNWRHQKYDAFDNWRYPSYSMVPLSYPDVKHWERLDDSALWTEVSYSEANRVEFFEAVNGAWRHAPPDARFLGQEVALASEHFRILGHEREVDLMARELIRLESFYRQIADVLQSELPPGERLLIRLTTLFAFDAAGHEAVDVSVESPYFSSWNDELGAGHFEGAVFRPLFEKLARQGPEPLKPTGPRELWWEITLGLWQLYIAELEPIHWPTLLFGVEAQPFVSEILTGELIPLSELNEMIFAPDPITDDWLPEDWTEDEAMLIYVEAITLVGYVREIGGPQAFPLLLQSLSDAESLESWLQAVVEVDLETFEANWQSWLREQSRP